MKLILNKPSFLTNLSVLHPPGLTFPPLMVLSQLDCLGWHLLFGITYLALPPEDCHLDGSEGWLHLRTAWFFPGYTGLTIDLLGHVLATP